MNVREIGDRLEGLSAAEIRTVREYEKRNKNRETLIEQFDRKLRAASAVGIRLQVQRRVRTWTADTNAADNREGRGSTPRPFRLPVTSTTEACGLKPTSADPSGCPSFP